MNIYQLRYYIAVVEEGVRFQQQPGKLNLSQPPLSTQIKLLEEEIRNGVVYTRCAPDHADTGRDTGSTSMHWKPDIERKQKPWKKSAIWAEAELGPCILVVALPLAMKEVYEELDAFHRQYPCPAANL